MEDPGIRYLWNDDPATSTIRVECPGQSCSWLNLLVRNFKQFISEREILRFFSPNFPYKVFISFEIPRTVLPASSNHALMKGQSVLVLMTEILWLMFSTIWTSPRVSPLQPLQRTRYSDGNIPNHIFSARIKLFLPRQFRQNSPDRLGRIARPFPVAGIEREPIRIPVTVSVPDLRQLLLVVGGEGAEQDLREVVRCEVGLTERSSLNN